MSSQTPDFAKRGGLLPVVVQDYVSREVLLVASMNEVAWEQTLSTRRATFWSTSRNELWVKGQTSGDFLVVREVRLDCDLDAILLLVIAAGEGACHTKNSAGVARPSCFFHQASVSVDPGTPLEWSNLDP
ncbi:MAG: phosphoribosyl-AMP cyclohydrolase [Spirochaetales bacterium]